MASSAEPVIRDADGLDVADICSFGDQYVRAHYAPILGTSAAADQILVWWNVTHISTAVAERLVVIAQNQGRLIGVGQRGHRGEAHVVYKLYVHPEYRGRRLGPRILDALIARVPADAGRLLIEHFVANERASASYEREGFVVERIDSTHTENPALGVVWRARHLNSVVLRAKTPSPGLDGKRVAALPLGRQQLTLADTWGAPRLPRVSVARAAAPVDAFRRNDGTRSADE